MGVFPIIPAAGSPTAKNDEEKNIHHKGTKNTKETPEKTGDKIMQEQNHENQGDRRAGPFLVLV